MSEFFFLFLTVLFLLAVFVAEDYVFMLLYLFVGAFFVGRWWGRKSMLGVSVQRKFTQRAFLGEKVAVRLQIVNSSWLPLAWLQIRESLPIELYSSGPYQRVVTLGPKGSIHFDYLLNCRKRGYYTVGPLDFYSSDVLGVVGVQHRNKAPDYLTIYPKIVPLTNVNLPSKAPLGTLRHHQPIFEDPSKVLGKREYIAGDSLRRVDWKATATTGRLQVKLFEPSIALEAAIFLNLDANEYDLRIRFDTTELAIIVAASLANWVISVRQSVGLVTNGADPLIGLESPPPVPPRRGRGHLLRILDILARIQAAETFPLVQLLQRECPGLSWGTTIILITNKVDDELFDGLFQARRSGLSIYLILCGPVIGYSEIQRKAAYFGIPIYQVLNERDLDIWRQ